MAATSSIPGGRRRSIGLGSYDYAGSGVYFITLCTVGRAHLFGEVHAGNVVLSELGRIVRREWAHTALVRPELQLDEYIVMPNHLHAIVAFAEGSTPELRSQGGLGRRARVLGAVVAGYKATCTVQINHARGMPGAPVWQRNYHERVIRSEEELRQTRNHIAQNPLRWAAK